MDNDLLIWKDLEYSLIVKWAQAYWGFEWFVYLLFWFMFPSRSFKNKLRPTKNEACGHLRLKWQKEI